MVSSQKTIKLTFIVKVQKKMLNRKTPTSEVPIGTVVVMFKGKKAIQIRLKIICFTWAFRLEKKNAGDTNIMQSNPTLNYTYKFHTAKETNTPNCFSVETLNQTLFPSPTVNASADLSGRSPDRRPVRNSPVLALLLQPLQLLGHLVGLLQLLPLLVRQLHVPDAQDGLRTSERGQIAPSGLQQYMHAGHPYASADMVRRSVRYVLLKCMALLKTLKCL